MGQQPQRGTIRVLLDSEHGFDPVFVADRFALPRRFTAHAELGPGKMLEVEVEVGTRAIARSVLFIDQSDRGIGWSVLAHLPVRDVVAAACRFAIQAVVPSGSGSFRLADVPAADARRALELVRRIVGYSPNVDGFAEVMS